MAGAENQESPRAPNGHASRARVQVQGQQGRVRSGEVLGLRAEAMVRVRIESPCKQPSYLVPSSSKMVRFQYGLLRKVGRAIGKAIAVL